MLLTCIRAHCTIHLNESYMDMTISEKLLRIKSLLIITLKIEWYLHGTDVWYEQRKLILTIFFGWTKEPINTLKMERFQFERRSEIEEAKELVTLQAIDWIKMKFVEQRACCWQLHSLRKKKNCSQNHAVFLEIYYENDKVITQIQLLTNNHFNIFTINNACDSFLRRYFMLFCCLRTHYSYESNHICIKLLYCWLVKR